MNNEEKKNNELNTTKAYRLFGNFVKNRKKVSESLLHFKSFHKIKREWLQYLIVFLIGIIYAFAIFIFVQITGLYETGLTGLCQAIARLVKVSIAKNGVDEKIVRLIYNILFWGLNMIGNIPIIIFGYIKLGKKICWMTLTFLVSMSLAGFAIASIPGSDRLFILGDPNTQVTHNGQDLLANVDIIHWQSFNLRHLSIIFYAIIFGFVQAAIMSIVMIFDATSAGFDIFAIYLSRRNFRDLGSMFFVINVISLLIANLLGTYLPNAIQLNSIELAKIDDIFDYEPGNVYKLENYFNITLIANFILIITNSASLNIFYPKFKLVKVEIITPHAKEIAKILTHFDGKHFSASIHKFVGGFSGNEQQMVVTNCIFMDAAIILNKVREIDESALFTVIDIKKMDGYVYIND